MQVRDLFEVLAEMMVNGDGFEDLNIEIFDEDDVLVGNLTNAGLSRPAGENFRITFREF